MNNNEFVDLISKNLKALSEGLLSGLSKDENLLVALSAEKSQFMRFNNNKMRQFTDVFDITASLSLHWKKKTQEAQINLTSSTEDNQKALLQLLNLLRTDIKGFPKDDSQVEMRNNGESKESLWGEVLDSAKLADIVFQKAKGLDFTGVYMSGVIVRANSNSLGQKHFYSSENFILDYSLFNKEKAVKGGYSGSHWSSEKFVEGLIESRDLLEKMNLPTQEIQKGEHRVYLAPSAVGEILGTIAWGGLSEAAYRQGQSGLKKLKEGVNFSDKFSLKENFNLGFATPFNSFGELPIKEMSLINKGELKTFLVNARTAKEYAETSNQADNSESLRSPEISKGSLTRDKILSQLGTGVFISNLHYLNWSDRNEGRITGMTRYACFWVEKGVIKGPIKDLRFDESLYNIFGSDLEELTDFQEVQPMTHTYGSRNLGGSLVPGLVASKFRFTL
jgi:predicted Zn-dependent protease